MPARTVPVAAFCVSLFALALVSCEGAQAPREPGPPSAGETQVLVDAEAMLEEREAPPAAQE